MKSNIAKYTESLDDLITFQEEWLKDAKFYFDRQKEIIKELSNKIPNLQMTSAYHLADTSLKPITDYKEMTLDIKSGKKHLQQIVLFSEDLLNEKDCILSILNNGSNTFSFIIKKEFALENFKFYDVFAGSFRITSIDNKVFIPDFDFECLSKEYQNELLNALTLWIDNNKLSIIQEQDGVKFNSKIKKLLPFV